jgi:hypothetical protein
LASVRGTRTDEVPTTKVYVVAIERYEHHPSLTGLTAAGTTLQDSLERGGGVAVPAPELVEGGSEGVVWARLRDELAAAGPDDRVVVLWSGHGDPDDRYYLLTQESPADGNLHADNSLPIDELASGVARCQAGHVLVVLDACYSAQGAAAIGQRLLDAMLRSEKRPGAVSDSDRRRGA